jgi:Uncharacterised protein family (UPF0158)
MRKLKVDMMLLELAWGQESLDLSLAYLDRETGQIITVTSETRDYVQQFDEEYGGEGADEDAGAQAFAEWLARSDCPEWQREDAIAAYTVESGPSDRYLPIPEQDSHEGFRDMEAFVMSVEDARVQERLARALGGRGTFRRFKDSLLDFPEERERWFRFEEERKRRRMREWLEDNDIEPVE